jgi:hypothetical protein
MQEELHLGSGGSRFESGVVPSRGAIAQLAEHQTRSRGLFLHLLSPQIIAMAPGFNACRGPCNAFTRAHNVSLHGAKPGIVIRQRLPSGGFSMHQLIMSRSSAARCK